MRISGRCLTRSKCYENFLRQINLEIFIKKCHQVHPFFTSKKIHNYTQVHIIMHKIYGELENTDIQKVKECKIMPFREVVTKPRTTFLTKISIDIVILNQIHVKVQDERCLLKIIQKKISKTFHLKSYPQSSPLHNGSVSCTRKISVDFPKTCYKSEDIHHLFYRSLHTGWYVVWEVLAATIMH